MRVTWKKTIEEKDRADWDTIFGNNVLKSFDLLRAVEDSHLKNIDIEYLYIWNDSKVVSILPCFTFLLELDLLTTPFVKSLINKIRSGFKNFLKLNIFFVGTPIAICDHVVGIHSFQSAEYESIFKVGFDEIVRQAKCKKCPLIIFKEIPSHDVTLLECFRKNNIIVGKSLPNSYVLLDKRIGTWTEAFRTRYRRRIRRQVKNASLNKEFTWEVVESYSKYAEIFEHIYLQVLRRSNYQFETLNQSFFVNVEKYLQSSSKAMICRNSQGKVVCFELLLNSEKELIPIYVGLDYSNRDEGDLYFSCIHNVVLYAEKNGYTKIKFGQTSYLAKAYAGCVFEELTIGVHALNPALHFFLKVFNKFIFTAPQLPFVHVYRDEMQKVLWDICKEKNIFPAKCNFAGKETTSEEETNENN